MAQIQNISYTHDQIMNWLMQNPEKSLRECADYFGYTQGWLSQVIHSDIFQQQFKVRQGEVFSRVAADIPVKLKALADVAIEKVGSALERSEDGEFALDVFDKTMHRLGYAPNSSRGIAPPPPQLQQNNFFIGKDDLAQLRQSMVDTAVIGQTEVVIDALPST